MEDDIGANAASGCARLMRELKHLAYFVANEWSVTSLQLQYVDMPLDLFGKVVRQVRVRLQHKNRRRAERASDHQMQDTRNKKLVASVLPH
ncbi:hypothetical protein [Rhizobium sp. WYCCWR 11128]|uniref:hypothetical protein n=1 Tax=Rhizobium sp. WYCCWR 11128 TaxID=2749832 RepID=UPI0015D1B53E|nr:hypothetical protein [Rhizobium sp. WYCCWR 11128]NYT33545.1 hypothetical protein [Rhizobium sp. WYCCWR 11128]